jgi:polyhydroxyalkanoate synthesis regulator phasin
MGGNDTTIGVSFKLRDKLKSMKIIEDETYPSVLKRIIEQAEKVPSLEKRVQELEEQLKGKDVN